MVYLFILKNIKVVKKNIIKYKKNLKLKRNKIIKRKIIFLQKIKKYYLVKFVKINTKIRLKNSIFLKKRKIENILYKNIKRINFILKNKIYIRMNVYKKRKNVFLNFSNIFSGNVYTSYSCGHYFKRSLRRTYYAVESLLMESDILEKKSFNKYWIKNKNKKKIWLFLIIKGDFFSKGLGKNLKKFIWKKKKYFKLRTIKNIQFKAHNGIRQRSKRRK